MVSLLMEPPWPDVPDGTQQQSVVHTVGSPAPQVREELEESFRVAPLEAPANVYAGVVDEVARHSQ